MVDLGPALVRINAIVEQQMRAENTPGLALALTDRERLLHVATWGHADVRSREPLTPDHLIPFGSIGKSFTALVFMQLREAGLVDLHAPVTEYLPWFSVRSEWAPITLHHLLSHTSGLSGGTEFTPEPSFEIWSIGNMHVAHPPGERYHYSNLGYKALGAVLERVLGQPYEQIVRERILEPLGMHDTVAVLTHEMRPRLATGHERLYDDRPSLPTHPLVPATWAESNSADGCISATAGDLATYLRMLLNRGRGPDGALMSEASFDQMVQPAIEMTPGRPAWYGYGLRTWAIDDYKEFGHTGGMIGYYAYMLGNPRDGVGIVVLINGPGAPGQIGRDIMRVLTAAARGEELPALRAETDPWQVRNASEYAGVYRSGANGQMLGLVAEGERLSLLHRGEPLPLQPFGGDTFLANHPDFNHYLLTFGRDGEQVVEAFHGPSWFTTERYNGPAEFDVPSEWHAYPGHYRSHNPWTPSFRVVLRKGQLHLLFTAPPDGFADGHPLRPMDDGSFGAELDGYVYDRLRFDAIIDGVAMRTFLSEAPYYRFFKP